MTEMYTLDEMYERADGKAFGEPELSAKDNALYGLLTLASELGYINDADNPPDEWEELLEKVVEDVQRKSGWLLMFDSEGHLFIVVRYWERG